eukprot:281221_1
MKDDDLVKDKDTVPQHNIEVTNGHEDDGGGKTVKKVLHQATFGKPCQRTPYSHLKKLLSSKPVLSLSASRSICSTTTSFGRAGAPTNPNQRIWNLLFRGIGIAVEDLYDLCELSK